MPRNSNFESQSFNSFSINEDFKDNNQDHDNNFQQTQIPNEVNEKLENFPTKIIFCPTFKDS